MTLHWWMHWFWITYQLISCISLAHSKSVTSTMSGHLETDVEQSRPLRRIEKSIGQSPNMKSQKPILLPFPATSDTSDTTAGELLPQMYRLKTNNSLGRIQCMLPPISTTGNNTNSTIENKNETQFLCNQNSTGSQLVPGDTNLTPKSNITDSNKTLIDIHTEEEFTTEHNFTEDILINVTVTSVITAKNRIKVSNDEPSSSSLSSISISGISFGVLAFIALIGGVSFMMYRKRYINKPQTLNDKCSNPDSSGYIDDSSMRENSEEMYSLDNDSFLNSLEAMTIQNYWTDNVKHTKL